MFDFKLHKKIPQKITEIAIFRRKTDLKNLITETYFKDVGDIRRHHLFTDN